MVGTRPRPMPVDASSGHAMGAAQARDATEPGWGKVVVGQMWGGRTNVHADAKRKARVEVGGTGVPEGLEFVVGVSASCDGRIYFGGCGASGRRL